MDAVEVVVVGAGVIGLACARELAQAGHEVLVLEREPQFGCGVSSRSSEVVHAGLYDEPGTLKARLCVEGRQRLAAYCSEHAIPYRCPGKLVVATSADERSALDRIAARAQANGIADIERLGPAALRELEPELSAVAALWSPASGIVDSHALMAQLLADAEAAGALLVTRTPFLGARRAGDGRAAGWRLECGGAEPAALRSRWVVNAAGLGAQAVAASFMLHPASIPPLAPAKGHYFAFAGRAPFEHLVYPVPVDGGLGVHLTLDLAGRARFGPDVEWLAPGAPLEYSVDPARAARFAAAIRRYWPGLPDGALIPAYSGIRPKLAGPGTRADFRIDGPAAHGCAGVVHLYGIESPGLTAALAVAARVAALVGGRDPPET